MRFCEKPFLDDNSRNPCPIAFKFDVAINITKNWRHKLFPSPWTPHNNTAGDVGRRVAWFFLQRIIMNSSGDGREDFSSY